MSDFTPTLFIDVGETGAFFTLRETYLHVAYASGRAHREVRSHHHFNLSQDPDEAYRKAQDFAEQWALELTTSRDSLENEMRAINRATAEEREHKARVQREEKARRGAELAAEEERKRGVILSGRFAFGNYHGKEFADAPRGYLTWLVDSVEEFEGLLKLTAQEVARRCADLLLPKPHPTLTVGEPKKRMEFEVTVSRVRWYERPLFHSYYGSERVYVVTMVDKATGACLLSMSPAFAPEEGEELKIRGTVKEHSVYEGQAQTVLQRVAYSPQ